MKNKILFQLKTFLLGQLILWFCTLIVWYARFEISNPYKIILNVSTINIGQRIGLLLFVIFFYIGNFCLIKRMEFNDDDYNPGIFFGYFLSLIIAPLVNCGC